MTKVVFAGSSIAGIAVDWGNIVWRPPAAHGDIARCVDEGASVIGLIDGTFESVASTWHKEILFAIDRGTVVLGASSMGALRAAECASFGMVPIGQIAQAYCSGLLTDDGDVALLMAPAELGFAPLSEALVDFRATLKALAELRLITSQEMSALNDSAANTYYKHRTVKAVVRDAGLAARAADIEMAYRDNRRSIKTEDALELIEVVKNWSEAPAPRTWAFLPSPFWSAAHQQLRKPTDQITLD